MNTLSDWRKNEVSLRERAETAGAHNLGLKRARKGNVPELERLLATWFKAKEGQGAVLPDAAILAKAKEIGEALVVAVGGAAGGGGGEGESGASGSAGGGFN